MVNLFHFGAKINMAASDTVAQADPRFLSLSEERKGYYSVLMQKILEVQQILG